MKVPQDLKYTQEYEWIRADGKKAMIGISEFGQDQLGDIVFVELPEVGSQVDQGAPFGVVESVKTVSDLYAPAGGKVIAVNKDLESSPEKINNTPYEGGWIVEIELSNEKDLESLLDADAYSEQCKNEME